MAVIIFCCVAGKVLLADYRRLLIHGLNLGQPSFVYAYLALLIQSGKCNSFISLWLYHSPIPKLCVNHQPQIHAVWRIINRLMTDIKCQWYMIVILLRFATSFSIYVCICTHEYDVFYTIQTSVNDALSLILNPKACSTIAFTMVLIRRINYII